MGRKVRTIIYLKWKLSGSIEFYSTLGGLFDDYDSDQISVSRHTLNKRDLFSGYENAIVEIKKCYVR